ncbi:jg11910 [Pararge aegeria aegeria]|uniref:Jg11910 protein n=1 Tax=Pararge aegeria aegeria TaxID=348720 RepID=A0A8S4RZZ1_9NEOP|nr:jg11910 [Pararge aegeria aegeria]
MLLEWQNLSQREVLPGITLSRQVIAVDGSSNSEDPAAPLVASYDTCEKSRGGDNWFLVCSHHTADFIIKDKSRDCRLIELLI